MFEQQSRLYSCFCVYFRIMRSTGLHGGQHIKNLDFRTGVFLEHSGAKQLGFCVYKTGINRHWKVEETQKNISDKFSARMALERALRSLTLLFQAPYSNALKDPIAFYSSWRSLTSSFKGPPGALCSPLKALCSRP